MNEVVTTNLEKAISPARLKLVIMAFRYLMEADKQESHFSINFCNSNESKGQEIWCIINEYTEEDGGLTATYLLPSDY